MTGNPVTKFVYDQALRGYKVVDERSFSSDQPGTAEAQGAICGSLAGFHRHRELDQTPCDDCQSAMRQAIRLWR